MDGHCWLSQFEVGLVGVVPKVARAMKGPQRVGEELDEGKLVHELADRCGSVSLLLMRGGQHDCCLKVENLQ